MGIRIGGRADRLDLLPDSNDPIPRHRVRRPPTQHDIGDLNRVQFMHMAMVGQKPNPGFRPQQLLQRRVARHDEEVRGIVRAGDDHAGARRQFRGLRATDLQAVQRGGDSLLVAPTGLGQLHALAGAFKQPHRQPAFQPGDVSADRGR